MENKFDQIKNRIKLIDYVQKFVRLKQIGTDKFVGLCPFHKEKTGSFHVSTDVNLYHCFGCGRGGDLISFYAEINHCDQKKALEDLALICGVSIKSKFQVSSLNRLLSFFKLNEEAKFFLNKRGVTDEFIKLFKLGWSHSFDEIKSFLAHEKLDFAKLGFKTLFFKFFENRVTFPIFDEYGSLVSFGGRCLDSRDGKYINGADSEIFHKNQILYGLNFVNNKDEIYLVEGYLDVVIMQQNGYAAVASMGTAISKAQLEKLWKFTDRIIVCFDGDKAGRSASYKTALLSLECISAGKEIFFIFMEDNEDPASYLISNDNLNELKKFALYDFFVNYSPIPENPDKKALYFKRLLELAEKINDPFLKIEYKKRWNEFRWKKNVKKSDQKLSVYDQNSLVLLLFKYVLDYNELIDQVAEDFLKLEMTKECKKNLISLLNGKEISPVFRRKIEKTFCITEPFNFDNAMEEWYKVFNHIQFISSNEREERLLNNFTLEEWELYKKWLEQKDANDEQKT